MTISGFILLLTLSTITSIVQDSPLTFEVASIKPNPGCRTRPRRGQGASPGRLNVECTTLRTAIENAYGVWANGISANPKLVQVSGGPGWIGSDEYEIVATAAGTPSKEPRRRLCGSTLAMRVPKLSKAQHRQPRPYSPQAQLV